MRHRTGWTTPPQPAFFRAMKRLAAALLLAAFATPAAAQLPLPVAVVSVERPAAPGAAAEVDALLRTLEADGVIDLRQPDTPTKRIRACGRSASWEGCIRKLLGKPGLALPARLAMVVDKVVGRESRVTCVSPGRRWAHVPAHTVWIDLKAALAEPAGGVYRRRAEDCLKAAVADRGF